MFHTSYTKNFRHQFMHMHCIGKPMLHRQADAQEHVRLKTLDCETMVNHGYPWLTMDTMLNHGYPWLTMDTMLNHGYHG